MEGKLQFHSCLTWLDMQTPIHIFESLLIDGSHVGDLLYWWVSCEYSKGCWRPLEVPVCLSVCLSLQVSLYSTLFCDLQLPWCPWTLSGVSSVLGVHQTPPVLPFPSPWPGNSLGSVSWDSCKSHLIWFPSRKDRHPCCMVPISWKPLFRTFCPFYCLLQIGGPIQSLLLLSGNRNLSF